MLNAWMISSQISYQEKCLCIQTFGTPCIIHLHTVPPLVFIINDHYFSLPVLTAAPNIEFGQEYFEGVAIKAGENIKLKVTISGRPTPKIKWFRDDVELTKKMVDITTIAGSSTLFIRDADRSHRGVYAVEAKNHCGTKKEQIKVEVFGMHNLVFPITTFHICVCFNHGI